jgi:hypothetical protein
MKSPIEENVQSYEEVVVGALANKVNYLVELSAAGKIQLAQNGIALGAIKGQMAPGDLTRPVRLLGKDGTVKVIQSAAIAPGARVILDVANPGKVKALPTGTPGVYRSLGIKESPAEYGTANGAAGDAIIIVDQIETVIVASADTITGAADLAALKAALLAILQAHGIVA